MFLRLFIIVSLAFSLSFASIISSKFIDKKVETIYKKRDFSPIWINDLMVDSSVFHLIDYIERNGDLLTAQEMEEVRQVKEYLEGIDLTSSEEFAKVDIYITKFYMKYAYILYFGGNRSENYKIKGFDVKAKKKKNDYKVEGFTRKDEEKFLKQAINQLSKLETMPIFIDKLVPDAPEYQKLKEARKIYEEIVQSGGFVQVDKGKKLKLGSSGLRVQQLYYRLFQTGDITERKNDEEMLSFDDIVDEGVKRFQKRFNLKEDGIVGKNTLKILNISAAKRIREIDINLRRWHFLPRDFDGDHILINIPDFTLRYMKGDDEVLRHKVIVGKYDHPTPRFSETMKYVVINPYWRVPKSIIIKEFVEEMQEDIDYLERQRISIYRTSMPEGAPVDPYEIDWYSFDDEQLAATGYNFIQSVGDKNALGRVKFLFPNRHSVYLHDTPSKSLFRHNQRSFSHGCIRLHNPLKFAEFLLNEKEAKGIDLDSMVKSNENKTLTLQEPVPVHIVYLTAFVDENGVNFRRDLYRLDKKFKSIKRVYNRSFEPENDQKDEKLVLKR
jgi:murein L,D-transpeptidase YcbB/YkuD